MNILVTGANGQLGNELRLLSKGSGHHFIFTDVNSVPGQETVYLDVTDLGTIRIICDSENVDAIINCAAYTNVDMAEEDKDMADLLNRKAPGNLAAAARERGITLIHISTDYIFSGDGFEPIREDAVPSPRSHYGKTKLAGEKAIQESGCDYIILRTAWMYSPFGKNFVKTIHHLTEVNDSLKVVYDQVGTPTYAADLAAVILHIIDSGKLSQKGVYNYTDEGVLSWYDFAVEICSLSGHRCAIRPCRSSEFPSKVRRPHYSVLDKTLIQKTFGIKIPYWRDSLKACMERL